MATSSDSADIVLPNDCLEPESVDDLDNVDLLQSETQPPVKSSLYSCPVEPCEGMVFDELEDAETCYRAYARRKGFSIRKSHTRLSKDKSLLGVEFACSREGYRRPSYWKKHKNVENRCATMIGCKAKLRLRRDEGKWVVSKFDVEHNHELCSPETTPLLPGHRKITRAQKNLIDVLNVSGIPTTKIMSVLRESGGDSNVGCTGMDVQNYLGSKKRKLLEDGDAQRMSNYFIKRQSENLDFVYAVQVDGSSCMGNCFWADARSRLAFQYFGDVVCFDATYIANRYGMPFVPFAGVNHHQQSVMFGCTVLVDKTTESYIWLFKAWVEAMGGRTPSVIITDDDKAMAMAISQVLPNTTHRLCMWHTLRKVPEYLAHVYNKYPSFHEEFHHCIYDTVTIEEFENEWNQLMGKYDLRGDSWLKDLYMRREKWVPAYLRMIFCAGMSTTQRSESMHKFFKAILQSSTLASDFVYQYEIALDKRFASEKERDVETTTTKAILKTCYKMEEEAAKTYTRKIFLLFQEELFSSQKHRASKYCEEGTRKTYRVLPNGKEKPMYEVVLDGIENKAICLCHMFEFVGIPCRHILAVFVKKCLVDYLPQQYVLRRWTMNAKRHGEVVVHEGPQISSTLLRNSLMMEFLKVVEEGQKSQRKHHHLTVALRKVHSELLAMDDERYNRQ
ncbi:protein FAR1-RELATED SEQUENCE 5-like [Actinidia eriantha]|uniref:protein FAR1-RELATED SEQUENCE 5-like n=1 Tax=Actinidia eriantha TaxID=165200 RepID=UPI0025898882|nr:protein FAR1-RELATED SEQUENCE 5-like [Actinidia eriantha]